MRISRAANEAILLTQRKYIRDLLQRHEMKNCVVVITSMMKTNLVKTSEDHHCQIVDLKIYQVLIKSLMHLMIQTRSDIAFVVSKLAQFMSNSINEHWIALKRVLQYLKKTTNLNVLYDQSIDFENFLEIWTNSNWTKDINDSRSIHEYFVFLEDEFVSWKSSKQQSISLFNIETEYVEQTAAVIHIVWIKRLLTKLKIDDIHFENSLTTIYADNQKTIKLTINFVFQKRSKHIAVRYHYTRDLINQKIIDLIYHFTVEMIADDLIKSLEFMKFSNFITRLRLSVKQDWFRSSEDVDNSMWESRESRYNTWHEVAIEKQFDRQTLSKLFSIYKQLSSFSFWSFKSHSWPHLFFLISLSFHHEKELIQGAFGAPEARDR